MEFERLISLLRRVTREGIQLRQSCGFACGLGRGCVFFGVQKFFLGYKRPKFFFFGTTKSIFGTQNAFSEYKKFVLDFFGGQRGLINCKIVLDILEGQKRQGWVFQRTAT